MYSHECEHDNLLSLLKQSEQMTVVNYVPTPFKKWGQYLDHGYNTIADGQVLPNHVFRTTMADSSSTTLIIKTDETEVPLCDGKQNLKKTGVGMSGRS